MRVHAADSDRATQLLQRHRALPPQSLGDGRLAITGPIHGGEQINRALADGGIYLSELHTDKAHLEQVFLSLTSDHDEAAMPQLETIA